MPNEFDEALYLEANADVRVALAQGKPSVRDTATWHVSMYERLIAYRAAG